MPNASGNPQRRAAFAAAAARVGGVGRSAFARDPDGGVVIGGNRLSKFYLRFHIALLILWSFCVGALMTKLLFVIGVDSMAIRYAASLLVSYGAFFVGVRLWLAYVGAVPFWGGRRSDVRNGSASNSGSDLLDWGGGPSRGSGLPSLRGGGGDFGGAGATSSFAEGPTPGVAMSPPRMSAMSFASSDGGSSTGGSSSGGGFGLDLDLGDDGWLVVLLLILVAAVLASLFGAVLYLVWTGPAMLAEVAFQGMLAAGLVKSTRNWRDACWETRLLKSTWIPFTLILVLAIAMAMVAAHLFPDAHTLGDMLRALRGRLG